MSVSSNVENTSRSLSTGHYDVIVVGAGPYGLSTAAHLWMQGVNVAVFGKPLGLWHDAMPKDMFLRSFWWATSLSDPHHRYGFRQYFQEQKREALYPLPIATFIDYGHWFQKQAVPHVDETYVKVIRRQENSFETTLEDGRIVQSRAVVMAPGLAYYTYCPPEYNHLPSALVTHTSEHILFDQFAGKQVAVIGGGQGALEIAALAHESGAEIHLVSRNTLRWLQEDTVEKRSLYQRMRSPMAGISPGWFNWGLEHFPYIFQKLPRATKDDLLHGRGSYGPAGAAWLKPRVLGNVTIHEQQQVEVCQESDTGATVRLTNGTTLNVDHILLGTGYRVDIKRLPMLDPTLLDSIQTYQQAPILNSRFESSVPGLYFVGISSVLSCGPLYRFVIGTDSTARRTAQAIMHAMA